MMLKEQATKKRQEEEAEAEKKDYWLTEWRKELRQRKIRKRGFRLIDKVRMKWRHSKDAMNKWIYMNTYYLYGR